MENIDLREKLEERMEEPAKKKTSKFVKFGNALRKKNVFKAVEKDKLDEAIAYVWSNLSPAEKHNYNDGHGSMKPYITSVLVRVNEIREHERAAKKEIEIRERERAAKKEIETAEKEAVAAEVAEVEEKEASAAEVAESAKALVAEVEALAAEVKEKEALAAEDAQPEEFPEKLQKKHHSKKHAKIIEIANEDIPYAIHLQQSSALNNIATILRLLDNGDREPVETYNIIANLQQQEAGLTPKEYGEKLEKEAKNLLKRYIEKKANKAVIGKTRTFAKRMKMLKDVKTKK